MPTPIHLHAATGHLPQLPVSSAALLPLDHPALGDLVAVAAGIEAALVPQAVELGMCGSRAAVAAASSHQVGCSVSKPVSTFCTRNFQSVPALQIEPAIVSADEPPPRLARSAAASGRCTGAAPPA